MRQARPSDYELFEAVRVMLALELCGIEGQAAARESGPTFGSPQFFRGSRIAFPFP